MNGFYSLCYWLEWPCIERYKCLEEPWPWNDDKEEWNVLYWKTVFVYSLNVLVVGPSVYLPFALFDLPVDLDMTSEGIPHVTKMFLQVLFCMVMEDLTFHFSHRTLHHPALYPYIHKIHHEQRITISFAAYYAHPLEFIFGNILPTVTGVLLLGKNMHWMTAFTWYIVRAVESTEGHSGYEFSWSIFRVIPFASDYGYHAYHHSHNIGNYSSFFTIWDTVFGTNSAYYNYLK